MRSAADRRQLMRRNRKDREAGDTMSKGLFITFEGTDGTGKSTQIEYAREFFAGRGCEVLMTREPGGTNISEKLRDILLDRNNGEMDDVTEMMIYAAARAQLVAEVIRPALDEGRVVICDRYVDSSVAYQAYGRNLGAMVEEVNAHATQGLEPDMTFFMDLDPAIGRSRIGKTDMDRLEQEAIDFFYRVYNGYRGIAEKHADRVVTIDATGTIDEVRAAIEVKLAECCDRAGI